MTSCEKKTNRNVCEIHHFYFRWCFERKSTSMCLMLFWGSRRRKKSSHRTWSQKPELSLTETSSYWFKEEVFYHKWLHRPKSDTWRRTWSDGLRSDDGQCWQTSGVTEQVNQQKPEQKRTCRTFTLPFISHQSLSEILLIISEPEQQGTEAISCRVSAPPAAPPL